MGRDMQTQEQLHEFLTTSIGEPLGLDDDYFELGLVNSLFALELIKFVEHRFGITIEVADLDLDHFRTINRLSDFVAAKTDTVSRP